MECGHSRQGAAEFSDVATLKLKEEERRRKGRHGAAAPALPVPGLPATASASQGCSSRGEKKISETENGAQLFRFRLK